MEYIFADVNQVPIKPQIGLTFAHSLRAFLRQDPDVRLEKSVTREPPRLPSRRPSRGICCCRPCIPTLQGAR